MEDDNSIRNRRARSQFTPTGPKARDGETEPQEEAEESQAQPAPGPEEPARPARTQLPAAPSLHSPPKPEESSKPVEPMKAPFVPRTPAGTGAESESDKSERAAVPLLPLAPTLRSSNKAPDLSKPVDFGRPPAEARPADVPAPGETPARPDALEDLFAPRPAAAKAENLIQPLQPPAAEAPPPLPKASEANSTEPAKTPFVGKVAEFYEEIEEPQQNFESVEMAAPKPARGRALPRWRRKLQASVWKISRPVVRPVSHFHRAVPAPLLAVGYLGLLACAAGFLIWMCFPAPSTPSPASPPQAAATAENSSPTPPGPSFALQTSGVKKFSLNPGTNSPVGLEQVEQMANVDFRAGRFAAAEQAYRKIFLTATNRAYIGYRIYVCSLKRDQHGQAEDLRGRLVRVGAGTPAWNYATATLAFREGRTEEARKILADVRQRFGEKCDEYDSVLRAAGYEP